MKAAKRNRPRGALGDDLVVFLGPSLPGEEARRIARCRILPPAGQGDVFRALALRPRAIALIDGVFEARPSVWHRELLAALDAGIAVFGASSMGALRAAELAPFGMVGVGTVYRWVRAGVVRDDSEVALLHAPAELGFRAFTLPLVNVRAAALEAVRLRALRRPEGAALVGAAQAISYRERTWPRVLEAVRAIWPSRALERFEELRARGLPDPKRDDAAECLRAAAAFARAAPAQGARPGEASALVRGRRLRQQSAWVDGQEVPARRVLDALEGGAASGELAAAGLRRHLLAAFARACGLSASPAELSAERARWLRELGVRGASAERFLCESALDEGQLARLLETRVLERHLLEHSTRAVPDGPSWLEGLVSEAQLRGVFARAARSLPVPAVKTSARRRWTGR